MYGVALLTSALLALADARIYERCELARDLLSFGVRREHLATWVCIAFHESRFDTAARNPYSGDHGILQISELYWCGAGKACSLPCSALRNDDISDDVECALRVHEEHTRLQGNGFLAWVVYPQHCKHNAKKYLADCDSSVKTPSVRTGGRNRVLKSQNRNVTSFSYNTQIDELLPPYLAIGSLFRGTYEKEFEQNYNNKVKFDWLNYKIDNIDDLKLPVFNQKVTQQYTTKSLATTRTTMTTTTTTTTTSSPLPNIKPPSPRRIESNSFRKKKLRPIFEPVQFVETTHPSSTLLTTSTSRNINVPTTEDPLRSENLLRSGNKADILLITTTTTTTTKRPSTKNLGLSSSFNAFTSVTDHHETTISPIAFTANPIATTISKEVSRQVTERSPYITKSLYPNSTKDSVSYNILQDKTNLSFSEIKNNASTEPDSILTTSTSIAPTVAFKNHYFNLERQSTQSSSTTWKPWSRSWLTWRTTPTQLTTTTPKPVLTTRWTWRTQNPSQSTVATTNKNITQLKIESTTSNPWAHSRVWSQTFKEVPELLDTNNNIRSTRTLLESTTSKPGSRISTVNPTSTAMPPIVAQNNTTTTTTTTTELPSPTSPRTTQSIFDLYLKPTTRPYIPAFSLRPFKNVASLRIFAGGTTTHSPSSSRNDSSGASHEATKNEMGKPVWQTT